MLLSKIILDNIGVYRGSNQIDLTTTIEKPIVLYGGINGAGKTTLFESIPLCLYGENFGRNKINKKQYHEKIHRLFHRDVNKSTSSPDASITLEFQYAQNGIITQYLVTRSWQNNKGKVDEFLKICKKPLNGKRYHSLNLEKSHLQQLINQMIPKTIADLFFFDGEKIQDLAMSSNENQYIKSSFDSILGLNISKQLYDDVGLYFLRNSDSSESEVLSELEKSNKEKDLIQKKIDELHDKRIFLNTEITRRHNDLELQEVQFFKLGGDFAKNRQKLLDEKIEFEQHISYRENILKHLVETDLPFVIISDQLEQIKDEIQCDITKIKENFESDTLNDAFDYIVKSLKPFLDSYKPKTKKDILVRLEKIVDNKLQSISDQQKLVFDFSLVDMKILQEKIQSMLSQKYEVILAQSESHKNYLEQLKELSAKLEVIPQQDEIGPLYSAIKEITLEIGEMEYELQTITRIESQKKSMLVLLNSKIRKCLSQRNLNQRKLRGLDMIPSIQKVLEDYSQKLREKKIKTLELNIFKGIKKCFHKDWLVTRISIDPETYNISLYQKNDVEIQKEKLSKGELQMYATAIIWGLAKTSGHPFPFIIDTPLARLDEQHRENLVDNFYPQASHQIIIFSTDTEIVNSYYDSLKPYISKVGLIKHDAVNACSVIDRTYFDKSGGDLIAV